MVSMVTRAALLGAVVVGAPLHGTGAPLGPGADGSTRAPAVPIK